MTGTEFAAAKPLLVDLFKASGLTDPKDGGTGEAPAAA